MKEHSQRVNIKTTRLASLTAVFRPKKQTRPTMDRVPTALMDMDGVACPPSEDQDIQVVDSETQELALASDGDETDDTGSDGDERVEESYTYSDSEDDFESDEGGVDEMDGVEVDRGTLEFELRAAEAGNVSHCVQRLERRWINLELVARASLNEAELKDVRAFNYFVTQGTTREAYEALRSAFPELEDISSIYLAQRTVAQLSGLSPKYVDCCVNSCCCYTGKYKMLQRCPFPDCNQPRYDENEQPRKQFQYLPIVPRLIALFLDKATAERMNYRHQHSETRDKEKVTDIFDGTLYQKLCKQQVTVNGKTLPHRYFSDRRDIALGLSLDGFAPFKRRSNSAWPVILFNYNLPPDLRTHLDHILCYGIIPGPKSVKDADSFLIPLYDELAQLSEGVDRVLDVKSREFFVLRAYLILVFGDIPAISKLLMMKGHNGYCPCRWCEITGVRNLGEKVNYFPLHREEARCDPHTLQYRRYRRFIRQATKVITAKTTVESDRLSRKYGIKGLPGLFLLGSIRFPASFPFDFMHLVFENLVPNLLRHYTGDFKGLDAGVESYELPKSTWEAIGDAAAQSGDTIPSDFGAQMPNIYAERSSMTAETWSTWIMYLGLVLLRDRFSKAAYYDHFSKLSNLVHLCVSYEMSRLDVEAIRVGFIEWVEEYEQYVFPHLMTTCITTFAL